MIPTAEVEELLALIDALKAAHPNGAGQSIIQAYPTLRALAQEALEGRRQGFSRDGVHLEIKSSAIEVIGFIEAQNLQIADLTAQVDKITAELNSEWEADSAKQDQCYRSGYEDARQVEETLRLNNNVFEADSTALRNRLGAASYPGHYISTACQRGKHEHCRLVDKWGGEQCQCGCGHAGVIAEPTYAELTAQVGRLTADLDLTNEGWRGATNTIDTLSQGVITIKSQRDEAIAQVERLTQALDRAPHADDCDYEQGFIHVEPCPFWAEHYCLAEPCIHGVRLGDYCSKCAEMAPGEQITYDAVHVGCHPKPCNCWKSRIDTAISAPSPTGGQPAEGAPGV